MTKKSPASDRSRPAFLFVPQHGAQITTMRISAILVIICALLIAMGFVGYLIPINRFAIDVVEQNQKKNLTLQNKKLLNRITDTRQQLHVLSEKVQSLKSKNQEIAHSTNPGPSQETSEKKSSAFNPQEEDIDAIVNRVSALESFFSHFAARTQASPATLNEIPIVKPIDDAAVLTARFGPMKDPFSGTQKKHHGVDFAAPAGEPVLAPAAGVVAAVENHPRWGRKITIRHSFGISTCYAHLGTVNVASGRAVRRGDIIATVGLSGITTGPHLHYEIWRNGKAVNPEDYLFPSFALAER